MFNQVGTLNPYLPYFKCCFQRFDSNVNMQFKGKSPTKLEYDFGINALSTKQFIFYLMSSIKK